jgi:hypothetical protein
MLECVVALAAEVFPPRPVTHTLVFIPAFKKVIFVQTGNAK